VFDRYIRVAAATPAIKVADCAYNAAQILELIKKADQEQVKLLCLPELCITGYTCGDLFLQDTLLDAAKDALHYLIKESADYNVLVVAGFPLAHGNNLYNAAAAFCKGQLLGFVPKTHHSNDEGLIESRYFAIAPFDMSFIPFFDDQEAFFGTDLLFQCQSLPDFTVAIEIGGNLQSPQPPNIRHTATEAVIITNPAANCEIAGRAAKRRSAVSDKSSRLLCGYVYANAGHGESTTDMVFSGHNIICENGTILQESSPFGDGWAVSEIDLSALSHDRRRITSFPTNIDDYLPIHFSLDTQCPSLSRFVDPAPFVPKDESKKQVRCEEVLNIQAAGLAKRVAHTHSRTLILGVSGGLDSSLALLASVKACKMIEKPASDILAVTMPCFGTTERTRLNAHRLCKALGITCREIDITQSVKQHLKEISHPPEKEDVVFENAQARMRTMVLMDLANQESGLVIGTGGLSELALGWATYNADHMSMYGVNSGVPKTLARHIVKYVADTWDNAQLTEVLTDILSTPISPELLSPKAGNISQHTEDIVGPYELHDFFLYHIIRWGRRPTAIFRLACTAFEGNYGSQEILKWLQIFYQRFFTQQFKRSCLPDGPKVGSVSLSPRGDWKMPSDAACTAWLEEIKSLSILTQKPNYF